MKEVKEKILYKGNWLALKQTTYKNNKNQEVNWESIQRTNTNMTVVICAKLIPSERYILLKQYRAPINNYVIGFPAGLVENGTIEAAAVRELEEETGYIGVVKEISPTIAANAALLTDKIRLVYMEVNESLSKNIAPKQNLEAAEEIEVMLIKRHEIKDFLVNKANEGLEIGIGPWYIFGTAF
jgi:ADP-ribose pyrophosphatase